MIVIYNSTIAEVTKRPNFPALAAAYAAEAQIKGLPPATTDMSAYQRLEDAGFLYTFSAHYKGTVVGFLTLLNAPHPRYTVAPAAIESFFVDPMFRSTGAGLLLLQHAEAKAKELGSPGLLASAPVEGSLAQVLPRRGFVETNRVFFKKLDSE